MLVGNFTLFLVKIIEHFIYQSMDVYVIVALYLISIYILTYTRHCYYCFKPSILC